MGRLLRFYCYCSCLYVCERNGQVSPEQLSVFCFDPALASILPRLLIWPCSCYRMDTSSSSTHQAIKLVRGVACVVISLESGLHPLSLALFLPVFPFGRSTLSAIPLDSGSLYCLTSFSPSSLSLGPWQLLSQCFAPRDPGRGGWVGKREKEKWNGGKE